MKPLLQLLLAVAISSAAANPAAVQAQLARQPNQLFYHVVPQQQPQQQQQQQLRPISYNLPYYVTAYAKVNDFKTFSFFHRGILIVAAAGSASLANLRRHTMKNM